MNKFIEVDPSDEITFGQLNSSSSPNSQNSSISQLSLKNISTKKIAFKIKTTAPTNYFVKPNQGQLDPQQKIIIDIKMHPKVLIDSNNLMLKNLKENETQNDKFLIQAIELDSQNVQSFSNVWKEIPEDKMLQLKLKVKIENGEPQSKLNQSQGNDLYYSQLQQQKYFPSQAQQVKAAPIQNFEQQNELKLPEQAKQAYIPQIQNVKANYKEKFEAMAQKVEDQEKFLFKLTEERNKYQEQYSKMKIQYKTKCQSEGSHCIAFINLEGFGFIQIVILLIIANVIGSYLGK